MKTVTVPSRQLILLLIGGSFISTALILVRIMWSESPFYGFMIWNLFLAWIPLIAAYCAVRQKQLWKQAILLVIWLVFFPNAPYVVTDFIHLYSREPIPLWYDLAHLSLFSWLGAWLGFLSLFIVQEWLKERLKVWQSWVIVEVVLFLSGYGIYLGRYLRWNSWDILANPSGLFSDTIMRLAYPTEHLTTWGVTIVFGMVLSVFYGVLYTALASKIGNKI